MAPMINPFDASGYTLAEMTTAIDVLPNIYTRLGAICRFRCFSLFGCDDDPSWRGGACLRHHAEIARRGGRMSWHSRHL